MKNIIRYFLRNKALTWLLLALVLCGGIYSYIHMGKLEDAPFTIKQAVIMTPYPGASPEEVRNEVTDLLEESIQSLDELYYLKSENRPGMSKITVYVKKEVRADAMQQLWDKLRRKVSDVQGRLPDGAGPSSVNDDFGDVLGVFYGLTGEGHSWREMEDVAKRLKDEILAVKDVARVEIWGIQNPTVDVTVPPSVLAQSGLTSTDIAKTFAEQNRTVNAGGLETGGKRLRIEATGTFRTLDDIRHMSITSPTGEHFRLGDIAEIEESYNHPATNIMRIEGQPALGIAVATVSTGNVVEMAKAVAECIDRFERSLPEGYAVHSVYDQGLESETANRGFVWNLVISVLTVVAILLFFIGLRNGLLIGSGLIFSIFATLTVMQFNGIALQRMSLAAIIIAMGMLVDNAIVVTDSALVNMKQGMRKNNAILQACSSTAVPLLAATLIAILTFLPIYYSPHITGELLSSLVIVIGVSLTFSWIFALVQTPFFIQEFVPAPKSEEIDPEPFKGKIYDTFRTILKAAVRNKFTVASILAVLLGVSAWSFRFIPKVFTPSLDKPYFTVDIWYPEGTRIENTDSGAFEIADWISRSDAVESVTSFIGRTPPRYYLSNASFGPQSNYAQLLIKCRSPKSARTLQGFLQDSIRCLYPEPLVKVNKFELNTLPEALIEARFLGPDPKVLDSLVNEAVAIMRSNPKTADARNEWGNMAMTVRPDYDPVRAGTMGISKARMLESVSAAGDGLPIGIYRDEEDRVPVMLHTPVKELTDIGDLPVWNGDRSVPLSQLTKSVSTTWEYPQIRTYNRQLSMAAMCGVQPGATMSEVHKEIRGAIEGIRLPEGYSFFWDSQFKDQSEAMDALTKYFPLAFIVLIVILVALFGNFREPLVIICMLPLSAIGVAGGMLATGFDFGFFSIAGWLGLLGMIIKNVIVLIDEINVRCNSGLPAQKAIVEATVARTRPVLMAAATTVAGMVPLLFDIAFGGMAATIIFGLAFATILTLFATPSIYAIFYNVKIR